MTSGDTPDEPMLLDRAKRGDPDAFQRLAEPYRRELLSHCYRMMGSLQEAEDLVQETFLRLWRGLDGFEERSSFRNWLHRIATNACLNALAGRKTASRVLPEALSQPWDRMPAGGPATEIAWLEPYPDAAFENVADTAPGPETRYEMRESMQLAFIAAIQTLPPRQRAVLLLRDVLGWSAADIGILLETSVASANSALQRGRATLEKQFPNGRPGIQPKPDNRQRILLERYIKAWEASNLDGFVALLKEEAVYSMPPWREWYLGRGQIRSFFGEAWGHYRSFRMVSTGANGQPAFALYACARGGDEWKAHSIQVLTLDDDAIASLTGFRYPKLFAAFGLPATMPA